MNRIKIATFLLLLSTSLWAFVLPFPSLTTSVGPGFSSEGANIHFDTEFTLLLTGQDFGVGPLVGFNYSKSDLGPDTHLSLGGSTLFVINDAVMVNAGACALISSDHPESPGYRLFATVTPEFMVGFELAYSHYERDEIQLLVTVDLAMVLFKALFDLDIS